jgi:hypothetical protein
VPAIVHPIPTVVAGIRFRSRIEARWAIFLAVIVLRPSRTGFGLITAWTPPSPVVQRVCRAFFDCLICPILVLSDGQEQA